MRFFGRKEIASAGNGPIVERTIREAAAKIQAVLAETSVHMDCMGQHASSLAAFLPADPAVLTVSDMARIRVSIEDLAEMHRTHAQTMREVAAALELAVDSLKQKGGRH